MKKCNNCGYSGLDDGATKCRCGAIEKTTISQIMFNMLLLSSFEFAVFGGMLLMINFQSHIEINIDHYLYFIIGLYFLQCLVYYIFNKLTFKNTDSKITTFTLIEPISFNKRNKTTDESIKSSSSNHSNSSNDNLITGIVIGAVGAELLDNN